MQLFIRTFIWTHLQFGLMYEINALRTDSRRLNSLSIIIKPFVFAGCVGVKYV
jgi:hypothetical protein